MLRFLATCGYVAHEFISAGADSIRIWLTGVEIRNDSAGIKGGLLAGPPFFVTGKPRAASRCNFAAS
jgi:hypothetical protein